MFGIVLVLLLASRAVFVFPIMALHNLWGSEKLPLRQIVVAWCARRQPQPLTLLPVHFLS